jgi:hypothetical protein
VITAFGRGNLALSLSISAVSSLLALILTPLNFSLMIAANPDTAAWARAIAVDPRDLVLSLVLLLAVPMSAAMLTTRYAPAAAARMRKPLARVSAVALVLFIISVAASQPRRCLVRSAARCRWCRSCITAWDCCSAGSPRRARAGWRPPTGARGGDRGRHAELGPAPRHQTPRSSTPTCRWWRWQACGRVARRRPGVRSP